MSETGGAKRVVSWSRRRRGPWIAHSAERSRPPAVPPVVPRATATTPTSTTIPFCPNVTHR
jgi:hypothetical protein